MTHSLYGLLQEQLRDLYDAQTQYVDMLPQMLETCTNEALRECLLQIMVDHGENVQELKEVCAMLRTPPDGVACEAMEGLIRETDRSTEADRDTATIDASLIANAQRIAHYEIAGFGTARAFASCLSEHAAATTLKKLTERASQHDEKLNKIATGGWFGAGVNAEAAGTTT
jgi:ferritin-like metal-binding protein YciE